VKNWQKQIQLKTRGRADSGRLRENLEIPMANYDDSEPKNLKNLTGVPDSSQPDEEEVTAGEDDEWGEPEPCDGSDNSDDTAATTAGAASQEEDGLTGDEDDDRDPLREPKPRDDGGSSCDPTAGTSERQTALDERAGSQDGGEADLNLPDCDCVEPDASESNVTDRSKTPEARTKRKISNARRGKNATKHGGFARDFLLPDENQADFARLNQGLIDEWGAESQTVKHMVSTLATAMWGQVRVERFCRRELALALEPPMQKELELIEHVMVMLRDAEDEAAVKRLIGMLQRDSYRKYFEREFPRAKYKDLETWLDALRSSAMPTIFAVHRNALLMQMQSFTFQTEQAERLRAKCEQILALQERAESRTFKAIKGLIQLKFWRSSTIPSSPSSLKSRDNTCTGQNCKVD
jgi:hypothetical protein